MINNEVIESYLVCPYKAFFRFKYQVLTILAPRVSFLDTSVVIP